MPESRATCPVLQAEVARLTARLKEVERERDGLKSLVGELYRDFGLHVASRSKKAFTFKTEWFGKFLELSRSCLTPTLETDRDA